MAEKKTKKSDKEPQKKGTTKEAPAASEKEIRITPRLGEFYKKEIVPALTKTFNYRPFQLLINPKPSNFL